MVKIESRRVAVFKESSQNADQEGADQEFLRNRRPDSRPRSKEQLKNDGRRAAQRDLDRAIYIDAWRRLSAITQIVTPPDGRPTFHSRLTHSQKVAQVSRSIATNILERAASDTSGATLVALAARGGYDIDVCEVAGLLHDIGHPPFGHIGEQTLNKYAQEVLGLPDGFEGNAQTMRILLTGRLLSNEHEGADPTAAVLAAVAKYPWTRPDAPGHTPDSKELAPPFDVPARPDQITPKNRALEYEKYSFYDTEAPLLSWCRKFAESIGSHRQTLEAATMDTADDITYAVHDLEDFLYAGRLDLARVILEVETFVDAMRNGEQEELKRLENPYIDLLDKLKRYNGMFAPQKFIDAAARLVTTADDDKGASDGFLVQLRDAGSTNQELSYIQGIQRGIFSHKIGELINAVKFQVGEYWTDGPYISLAAEAWHEVQILKSIARRHIIQRPDIALLQHGQSKILWAVCEDLTDWVKRDPERLPEYLFDELATLRWQLKSGQKDDLGRVSGRNFRGSVGRVILDYICTLSDNQCVALYKKLRGGEVHKGGISEVF